MEISLVGFVRHVLVAENMIVNEERFGDFKLVHYGEDFVK